MKIRIISDTHLNPENIDNYCQRPANFTDLIVKNWRQVVQPTDMIIHVGDVGIGKWKPYIDLIQSLPGRKILVRGNHDWHHSCAWWCEHGFDFACDALTIRNAVITHHPRKSVPDGFVNIHGHLHNWWTGFRKPGNKLQLNPQFNRLFAVEYTNYKPVEMEEFLSHPDKYKAIEPGETT